MHNKIIQNKILINHDEIINIFSTIVSIKFDHKIMNISNETVQILTKQVSPEILDKNLEHLRLTIPRSLDDLRSGL